MADPKEGVETPNKIEVPEYTGKTYPFSNSEKVWIHRAKKKPVLPEYGVVGDTARDWSLMIGPSFAGPNTGVLLGRTIITPAEERKYMPAIIGIQPTHTEWDKMLNDYWANLLVNIPYEGKELEVGYLETSETEKEPINVLDWLLYKYCLKYGGVANSMDEVGSSTRIRFYLFKETEARAVEAKMKDIKDKAIMARFELEKETEKMQSLIILSGNPLPVLVKDQQLLVTKISETDPVKFLKLYKDKLLLEKAFVERLIRHNLMIRPLNSTLVIYDGTQIGANLEEATIWLKQPINSEALLTLREQLRHKEQV